MELECICKYFVNYRWNGLTGGELCDIIEMSKWENRFEKAVENCKNVGMDRKIVEGLFKN